MQRSLTVVFTLVTHLKLRSVWPSCAWSVWPALDIISAGSASRMAAVAVRLQTLRTNRASLNNAVR